MVITYVLENSINVLCKMEKRKTTQLIPFANEQYCAGNDRN